MKHINTLTLILLGAAIVFTVVLILSPASLGLAERSAAYEVYFDSEEVTTIKITISEEDWTDMLENPLAEEYHTANIEINGDLYSGVGIRTKGMTSLSSVASSDSDRYSFKVHADEYVSGQSFLGLDEFVLNNNYQDPTYMKEFLSYEMMEEVGVATPLHAYAAVYINGEYWGLYLMVEAVEEDFAARNYSSNYGELYKPETMDMGGGMQQGGGGMPNGGDRPQIDKTEMGMPQQGMFDMSQIHQTQGMDIQQQDMPDMSQMPQKPDGFTMPEGMNIGEFGGFGGMGGGADLVYTDDNPESYSQIFENAVFDGLKEADKKRVITALKYLGEGSDLETYVDVDAVLRYFAANTALVNLDSYVSSLKHNYYLYEEDGQISILPWDFNLAFGTFQGGDAEEIINFPIDTPVADGISLEDRPLIGSLLEVEEYKERYHDYLRVIAEEFFGDSFAERVDSIDALIGSYVETDPTAFYSYAEYKEGLDALKTYAMLRAESILGQIEGKIPATHDGQKNSTVLVDASGLSMQSLGTMGGGMGGKDFGGFEKGGGR